jgi:RNA polymerase sigma-B factor
MTDDVDDQSTTTETDAALQEQRALELFAVLPDDKAREELVRMFFPLVEYLSRRFRSRGEPLDDLIQVASIGLLKAIDRFETERGVKFSTYAVPTIIGELKRHFRDTGWAMRVPRRLQERALLLRSVMSDAYQELGRSPTVAEIGQRADLTEEEVLEAMDTMHAHSVESLDAPIDDDENSSMTTLGTEDQLIEQLEGWADVAPLLRTLPERERLLLYYRYVAGMPQSQIAEKLGISQMHVSRLLSRTLQTLRSAVSGVEG